MAHRHPVLVASALIFAVVAAVSGRAQVRNRQPGIRLFHVFNCRTDDPRQGRLLEQLQAPLRQLVADRLTLCARYEPSLPPAADPDKKVIVEARRQLERAIVVFLGRPDLGGEAAAFAREAPLSYEWEGFPEGPMMEAAYADDYLHRHESTELKPYLQLFLLYRYRAAYEAATWSAANPPIDAHLDQVLPRWQEVGRHAADEYARVWADVQRNGDTLTKAVADDLDRDDPLYVGPAGHPRRGRGLRSTR